MPVIGYAEFKSRVRSGAQWLIVDGTVVNVEELIRNDDGIHKGGCAVLRVGEDITYFFRSMHANLPRISSVHRLRRGQV